MLTATGCESDYGMTISGVLVSRYANLDAYGDTILLRAVPDHVDGFSPDRPYRGGRVVSANCPLEHTEIPLDFWMVGDADDLDRAPPRWLLLAWIGDDETETWVTPGQLYGTTTFEFIEDGPGGPAAWDLQVQLNEIYGARRDDD